MIEKKAKRELISTNTETTWNVLFIGLGNDDTINFGKERFLNDLRSAHISTDIRTSYLDFPHDTQTGSATFTHFHGSKEHMKITHEKFDSHKTATSPDYKNYADYFDFVNTQIEPDKENKYILIVLAHSFGTGLAATDTSYLKINNLVELIDKKIKKSFECVLALNCTFQTIENNFLFAKIAKYLIGSQQPLYVVSIGYRRLLEDLHLVPFFGTAQILSKFVFETADTAKNDALAGNISAASSFNMTITKPAAAYLLMLELNYLSKLLTDNDNKDRADKCIPEILSRMYDATKDYILNMYDAVGFMELMLLEFREPSKINKCLKRILNNINRLVMLNHSSSQNIQYQEHIITGQKSLFVPSGIGLTLPISNDPSVRTNVINHVEILKQFEDKVDPLTYKTWARFVESWLDDDQETNNGQLLSDKHMSLYEMLTYNLITKLEGGKDMLEKLWIQLQD
jgi:hypothetical protein